MTEKLAPVHELRRQHLRREFKNSGLKQVDFAKKIGTTPQYLSLLLKTNFRFGEKAARNLERSMGLPKGTFDTSLDETVCKIDEWEKTDELPKGVFAVIPQVGISFERDGVTVKDEFLDAPPLAVRDAQLRKMSVTSRTNLRICEVHGDSMAGYLQDRDTALIDMGQKNIIDNEVYALRYGNSIKMKRLAVRFDGGLFIRSDNQRYPEEILTANEINQIVVLGRVIWRGG